LIDYFVQLFITRSLRRFFAGFEFAFKIEFVYKQRAQKYPAGSMAFTLLLRVGQRVSKDIACWVLKKTICAYQ